MRANDIVGNTRASLWISRSPSPCAFLQFNALPPNAVQRLRKKKIALPGFVPPNCLTGSSKKYPTLRKLCGSEPESAAPNGGSDNEENIARGMPESRRLASDCKWGNSFFKGFSTVSPWINDNNWKAACNAEHAYYHKIQSWDKMPDFSWPPSPPQHHPSTSPAPPSACVHTTATS